MQAYLIDPWAKCVEPVEYSGDFRQIYEHIDAEPFTAVRFSRATRDCVFVDDCGLLRDGKQAFFYIDGYIQPLAGKGLILGTDAEGESISPSLTLEEVRNRVTFLGVRNL